MRIGGYMARKYTKKKIELEEYDDKPSIEKVYRNSIKLLLGIQPGDKDPLALAIDLVPDENIRKSGVMANSMTYLEKRVWSFIGKKNNPWQFVPQFPIGPYILDFFSPMHKAALEADGPEHLKTIKADQKRDEYLEKLGIKTMRLTPSDFARYKSSFIIEYIEGFLNVAAKQREEK
jgi:very-short-patch-repair endonuclease